MCFRFQTRSYEVENTINQPRQQSWLNMFSALPSIFGSQSNFSCNQVFARFIDVVNKEQNQKKSKNGFVEATVLHSFIYRLVG